MIERKRRNDFVRKREFDMLRKVRREGLSSEQIAALGSSRLDDSQPRASESPARQDAGVKAKIDEIEQQMVGDNYASTQRRGPEFYNAPTQPVPIDMAGRPAANAPTPPPQGGRVEDFVPAAEPAGKIVKTVPAAARSASIAPIKLDLTPAERLRPGVRRQQRRGHPRPRPRRGGDRLRQRRLRAVRAVARGADRPRRRPRPACRDLAGAVRPLPRHRPAEQVREPGARLRAAVRLVGAAVVLDAEDGRRGGQRGAAERQPGSKARSAGSARSTSMPTASPSWRRWRCRCRCPGCSTGARCRPSTPRPAAGSRSCSAAGSRRTSTCAGSRAIACSPWSRKPRRPACATPTRRSGSCASTPCA